MRKLLLFALALHVLSAFGQNTIVNYDFNAGTTYATFTPTLAGNITSTATSTEAFQTYSGTASGAGAFTSNNTAGNALGMANSSGTNTRYFQFQLGGSALNTYSSFKIYFQAQRSGTGATTATIAYSTNGSSYTNFATTQSPGNGSFSECIFDLSAITAINFQSAVYFRVLTSGASGTGTLRMDNFQIRATASSFATDYFRSKTSGNWTAISTWESSTDGSTNWMDATLAPTSVANTVSVLATHTVTMDANTTVGNVNVSGTLAIAPNIYITVASTKTVANSGTFVLKSDVNGTGGIGNSAGSITGNVTVERYLTAQRAYRLLGHPFSSNVALSSLQPYVDVTGSGTGLTPGSASAFNYLTGVWSAYTSNTQTWNKNQGLLLFVRGIAGEGIGVTNGSYTPTAPIISLTGTVNTGNVNYTVNAASSFSNGAAVGWNAIGNPYPAPIDVNSVAGITAPGGSGASIYVWNATKGSTGSGTASGGYDFYTLGSSIVIPTYGAFFIKNTSGLDQPITFNESNKNTGTTPLSLMRVAGAKEGFDLVIADNATYWDRLRINLDNSALTASTDKTDLDKFSNTNLDFYSIGSDKNKLAVNSRPQFQSETDAITLGLKTNQTRTFTVSADNVNLTSSDYELYLNDKYANKSVKIVSGMGYSFDVTADAATQGENRFEIIAKKVAVPIVLATTKITISPNPVVSQLNISSTGNTTVRIMTALGQVVKTVKSTDQTIQIPVNNLTKGLYIVEVKTDKETVTTQIVKQ